MKYLALAVSGGCGLTGEHAPTVTWDAPATSREDRSVETTLTVTGDEGARIELQQLRAGYGELRIAEVSRPDANTLTASLVFTPQRNFFGHVELGVVVRAGDDHIPVEAHLELTPEPDGPQSIDDVFAVERDTPLEIPTWAVYANDLDGEDQDVDYDGKIDLVDTLAVTEVRNPSGGTVTLTGGKITFLPDAGFIGRASFGYTLDDGTKFTNTGRVHIHVGTANDAPIATDDMETTWERAPLVLRPGALIGNDVDFDGQTLRVIAVGNAVDGTVTLDEHGVITYTPSHEDIFQTKGSFEYTVTDGIATDVGHVDVTIAYWL